ncbi:MAG: T9SS type A sorting domain-containing protein [Candidatus Sabulitectum sp.]|nr:T9SS type A sorting domain-containing protein [Candidatus Sabulitectum sp.]
MKLSVILLLAYFVSALLADSADQTDWSGGAGETGPVSSWTDSFMSSSAMEFAEAPGIISAADLTGDGKVELFAGSLYSFNITWWKTFGYQPEGSLVSSILDTGEDSEWINLEWTADLTVYDLSGRSVFSTGETMMNRGMNEFSPADLSDGIYLIRLNLKDRSLNVRITVLL